MDNDLVKLYKRMLNELQEKKESIKRDYWRLGYHLMPPIGWINDPNGMCEFNGVYHVYYQYSPFEAEGGLKFWGHYSSKDFINWTEHEIALYPDQPFDCHGVFSGTTFIEGDTAEIFYTGMVKRQGYDDFTVKGMEQNTVLVTTRDGINFSEKKLLMKNEDYPANMSWHVRDPKVWKEDDTYYMVLGARDIAGQGCVLVYKSNDKENWENINIVRGEDEFSYMWECPDYFKLDNTKILITCPQGVERSEELPNVHQCGYFSVEGDITTAEYQLSEFRTLDRGFDFYAPQTFEDSKGRRILVGWVSLSDCEFGNPTIEKGWQHCLSIPRELRVNEGKIVQIPIKELEMLRKDKVELIIKDNKIENLYGDKFELELNLEGTPQELDITLRKDVHLIYHKDNGIFTLKIGECGYGRKERIVRLDSLSNIRIFSDTSSLEIFLNDGEEVFTTRIYPDKEDNLIEIKGQELKGSGVKYILNNMNYN